MKPITAYTEGWKLLIKYRKMWLLLYLLNFCFALIGLIPLSGFLNQTLAHSLENTQLLNGFDYTFFQDFLSAYGLGISAILDQSILLIVLFFIFSIFLVGGMLSTLKSQESFNYGYFLQGCSHYFWRLLRLTIYFLILHFVLIGACLFLLSLLTNGLSPFELDTDVQVVNALTITVPLYILLATILFMIQDYAKIHLIHEDVNILTQVFWQSFSLVFRNFGYFFLLYLLNFATFLIFLGLYWFISENVEVRTGTMVFIFFLIAQAYVFARIGVRVVNLASATLLYQDLEKEEI